MKGEHITRDSLVDMFASFDIAFRQGILHQLEVVIKATQADAKDTTDNDTSIQVSYNNLLLMQSCCQQAQQEYLELCKKAS